MVGFSSISFCKNATLVSKFARSSFEAKFKSHHAPSKTKLLSISTTNCFILSVLCFDNKLPKAYSTLFLKLCPCFRHKLTKACYGVTNLSVRILRYVSQGNQERETLFVFSQTSINQLVLYTYGRGRSVSVLLQHWNFTCYSDHHNFPPALSIG